MRQLVFGAMFACVSAPAVADCDPGERVVRFSHVVSATGHPKGEAATALADWVNADLDGTLCMVVHPSSELFNDDDVLDAMLAGEVELAAPSLSKFEPYTTAFQLFDLPFLFDGPLAAMAFLDSPAAQDLKGSMADQGLVGLHFWTNGMKQLSSRDGLRVPSDAEGLRFRIQPSDVIEAQFDALGATAIRLPFSQVYDALASGEVDGQQNTWSNIHTRRFHTEQAAITESDHAYLGYLVVTSQAFLDSLDPETRETFLFILELTTHERNRFAYEINQLARQRVIADGVPIIGLSPEEREVWRAAFAPVWDRFSEAIGPDLIAAASSAAPGLVPVVQPTSGPSGG